MNRPRAKALWFGWAHPIVCGAVLSLAYEPVSLSWLVWMIPALLCWGIYAGAPTAERGRWGLKYGALSGAAFFLINVKWLHSVSPFAATALALFLTLFWTLWGFLVSKWGCPPARPIGKTKSLFAGSGRSLYFALLAAGAWVICEWLRSWVLTGFPWNGLGLAVAESNVLAQSVDLIGVTGLSFLPVFVGSVIVQSLLRMRGELQAGRLRPRLDFAVAMLLIVVFFGYGALRMRAMQALETERLGVVLVQQNIPQSIKWQAKSSQEIYAGYVALTEDAVKNSTENVLSEIEARRARGEEIADIQLPRIDMVVWPETALPEPFYYEGEEQRFQTLRNEQLLTQQILTLGDFDFVLGTNDSEMELAGENWVPKFPGAHYNAMMSFRDSASPDSVYRKAHLVIYGEYIPLMETLPFLKKIFEWSTGETYYGNVAAGDSYEPMETASGVSIIPSICFEDSIARVTRKFVRQEPQVIVNVTNDGWFLKTEAARQHAANARMRAIELRRPMVRAANTGVSIMYDHIGNVVQTPLGKDAVILDERGSHFTPGWVYADVAMPVAGPMTLYAMAGDWFAWVCLVVVLGMILRRQFSKDS